MKNGNELTPIFGIDEAGDGMQSIHVKTEKGS